MIRRCRGNPPTCFLVLHPHCRSFRRRGFRRRCFRRRFRFRFRFRFHRLFRFRFRFPFRRRFLFDDFLQLFARNSFCEINRGYCPCTYADMQKGATA